MTTETSPQTSPEILARLIGFDTVSARSNLDLIAWVESYLAEHGVASRRVPDETGAKASLIATIGPEDQPGWVLSGHTDVVPVEGQAWSSDPFEARVEGGRLYGRGAADMKGFLACALAAVPRAAAAPLTRPIHLAFSYDEEVGCVGVRPMLAEMAGWAVRPLGCIVGEPSEMQVITGHKHKLSKTVVVEGLTGHSSRAPEAVNAVEYAARLVAFISDLGRRLRANGPRDALYDVAHTTAHVGRLAGGTQLNIVPERCSFDFEFRAVPGDDPHALLAEVEAEAARLTAEMQAVAPETGIRFEPYSHIPGLETDPGAEIAVLVKRLAGRNDHAKVAYSTEGGLFAEMAGVPAVICGPGSIREAHKPDEFIALSQLADCDAFLERLIAECC
ncbi:MAG: acetylornithine deacetylase [Pseudomonadota bacterium]